MLGNDHLEFGILEYVKRRRGCIFAQSSQTMDLKEVRAVIHIPQVAVCQCCQRDLSVGGSIRHVQQKGASVVQEERRVPEVGQFVSQRRHVIFTLRFRLFPELVENRGLSVRPTLLLASVAGNCKSREFARGLSPREGPRPSRQRRLRETPQELKCEMPWAVLYVPAQTSTRRSSSV